MHHQSALTHNPDGAYTVEDRGYTSECHIWQPAPTLKYGSIKRSGKNFPAHRFFYERDVGPIPEGHHLHHACEQTRCVNVAHLVPLTARDHRRVRRDNKLDADKAADIKQMLLDGGMHKTIAAEFGVCRPTITMIKNGVIWQE
jgi:hypothetical protein